MGAPFSRTFDILIVGAGPAGSYLAHLLAHQGVSVAIIDKEPFPRYKVCGGGLCLRAVNLLPFDLSSVVEDRITSAVVTLKCQTICHKQTQDPMIYMVSREVFDTFLMEKAIMSGANFWDATALRSVEPLNSAIEIKTSKGAFKTKLIAGADGALSKTARLLGLGPAPNLLPAIEAEIAINDLNLFANYRGCVHFDLAIPPHGYGWIFPKNDHLSVGVFSTRKKERKLKFALQQYMEHKGLQDSAKLLSLRGHTIPAGLVTRRHLITKRGLLLGDAAGFADPITGEGIYHALAQAELAASCILDFLKGDEKSLKRYEKSLFTYFKREHLYAWLLGAFFYKIPALSHRLLRRHADLITDLHIDVITGQRLYKDLIKIALWLKRP